MCIEHIITDFIQSFYIKIYMETTLVLLKPSCVQRQLIGEIVHRFERRGLRIAGMKMMQLDEAILRDHYSHLVDRPFFPALAASMMASPIVAMAICGVEAVSVVRAMTGYTNGRVADPGTIRGDYSMSNQQNIVHASDSIENAAIELKRFFRPEEIFEYESATLGFIYAVNER
jgi:nucleoside-diphosphate kinase